MAEKVWLRFKPHSQPVEFEEKSRKEMDAFLRGVAAVLNANHGEDTPEGFFQFDEEPFKCPECAGDGRDDGHECTKCGDVYYVSKSGLPFFA